MGERNRNGHCGRQDEGDGSDCQVPPVNRRPRRRGFEPQSGLGRSPSTGGGQPNAGLCRCSLEHDVDLTLGKGFDAVEVGVSRGACRMKEFHRRVIGRSKGALERQYIA